MADANQDGSTTYFGKVKAVRKKTAEACERCREKRIKCNGFQPCHQCIHKDAHCIFAYAPSTVPSVNEAIVEKLELVLSRLDKIDSELTQQARDLANLSRGMLQPDLKQSQQPVERRSGGVAQFNQETGCFEYYGQTSAITIASRLGKRMRQLEDGPDNDVHISRGARRRTDANYQHTPAHDTDPKGPVLDELPSFCDYVMPLSAPCSDRFLNESIADRHVNSFFESIHILIPILNPTTFKAQYMSLRQLLGDGRLSIATQDDPTRPQFVCLLYAVLALGALYEHEREDSSSWAPWYFSRAQRMLGRLLNASNLSLVQASLLLGAYAQHAIRPNLAYILNGIAARLAFSNGLNIESLHSSLPIDTQEAKRTWWVIYIQEVELCLDSGRPMCFRSSDTNMHYPTMHLLPNGEVNPLSKQDMFIPLLVGITKIMNKIIDLSIEPSEPGNSKLERQKGLLCELNDWRASLPQHLRFKDPDRDINDSNVLTSLYTWESRQQSSLQIRQCALVKFTARNISISIRLLTSRQDYYLAVIILFQEPIPKSPADGQAPRDQLSHQHHKLYYLNSARNMIRHIHRLLTLAPHLRRWTYYCFYCLQAVLAILPQVRTDYRRTQSRKREEANISTVSHQVNREPDEDDRKLCNLAVEIFEQIKLKASQRCADVIRHYLNQWKSNQTTNGTSALSHTSSSSFGNDARQPLPSTPALPLSFNHSQALDHEAEVSYLSPDAAQARPRDASAIESISCTDLTSPCISLSEFQAQLYSAFYENPNDGFDFDFDQQSSLPGLETLGGSTLRSNTIGTQDDGWTAYNQ